MGFVPSTKQPKKLQSEAWSFGVSGRSNSEAHHLKLRDFRYTCSMPRNESTGAAPVEVLNIGGAVATGLLPQKDLSCWILGLEALHFCLPNFCIDDLHIYIYICMISSMYFCVCFCFSVSNICQICFKIWINCISLIPVFPYPMEWFLFCLVPLGFLLSPGHPTGQFSFARQGSESLGAGASEYLWYGNPRKINGWKLKTGWPSVGNEDPSTFTFGILGMKLPSFPTKGQLENHPIEKEQIIFQTSMTLDSTCLIGKLWGSIFCPSNHCIRELGECQVFLKIFIPTKARKMKQPCWRAHSWNQMGGSTRP